MKKHIFIMMLFALCLTSFQAHAQRYLPGMKGLQVTAGMADGVHWNSDTDFAYHIGAAYSVYTKNANRWVLAGNTCTRSMTTRICSTRRTVHRRGRLLPEIPIGQAKDLFPVAGTVGTRWV